MREFYEDIEEAWNDLDMYEQENFIRDKADEVDLIVIGEDDAEDNDYGFLVGDIKDMVDKFKMEGEETLYTGQEVMRMLRALVGDIPQGTYYRPDTTADKKVKAQFEEYERDMQNLYNELDDYEKIIENYQNQLEEAKRQ